MNNDPIINDLCRMARVIDKTQMYQAAVYHGLLCVFSKDGVMFDPDCSSPIPGLLREHLDFFNEVMTTSIIKGKAITFADMLLRETIKATLVGKFNHMQATAFLNTIQKELDHE